MNIEAILRTRDAIRTKHPEARKPDPDGEPPWEYMSEDSPEPPPDVYGSMDCIECKAGVVKYRISNYNGHIAAKCDNKACCIGFME